jgi:hypothetical protein
MTIPLTAHQLEAMGMVELHGTLVYLKGGWWTYPGCPERDTGRGYSVPDWYVTMHTVKALIARDLVVVTERAWGRTDGNWATRVERPKC